MISFQAILISIGIYIEWSAAVDYTNHVTTSTNQPYNFILNKNDRIYSTTGNTKLTMQNDGNFVLRHNSTTQWHTGIINGAEYVEISRDGNIFVKDDTALVLWTSSTSGHNDTSPHHLVVDDACVYLMNQINNVFWSQGDGCIAPYPTFHPPQTLAPTSNPTGTAATPTESPSEVTTYELYASKYQLSCQTAGATASDTCIFHCDQESWSSSSLTFNCGNADTCVFLCTEPKCFEGHVLQASNTSYLNVTSLSGGSQCFKEAEINLPNYGSAIFNMEEEKAFKEMVVNTGTHTNSIIIDCTFGNWDECKGLKVYASTAKYLEIKVGADSSLYTNIDKERGVIYCPQNSAYVGCVIDLSDGGYFGSYDIYTLHGIPADVEIQIGTKTTIVDDTVIVHCINGTSVNSQNVFQDKSECWNTRAPTADPTISPTHIPTLSPTNNPTSSPTNNPTKNPTIEPTSFPSAIPSMSYVESSTSTDILVTESKHANATEAIGRWHFIFAGVIIILSLICILLCILRFIYVLRLREAIHAAFNIQAMNDERNIAQSTDGFELSDNYYNRKGKKTYELSEETFDTIQVTSLLN